MSGGKPAGGSLDPNLPLEVQLDAYEKGEAVVIATLDVDRVVLRIIDKSAKKPTGMVRAITLDDAVSQAAWLIVMAEAGGLDNVMERFQAALTDGRQHVRERQAARFPKTAGTEKKP